MELAVVAMAFTGYASAACILCPAVASAESFPQDIRPPLVSYKRNGYIGMGERAGRQPDHGECAGAGRTNRDANDLRPGGRAKKCCGRKSWARPSLGWFRTPPPASTDSASPRHVGDPRCRRLRLRSARAARSGGRSWRPMPSGSRARRLEACSPNSVHG